MEVVVDFNIINCFTLIFHVISLKVVGSVVELFSNLIELTADTDSVSCNSDSEIVLVFYELTGSGCTFVSGTIVLDARGFLGISAGKPVAHLWYSNCTWSATPQHLQVLPVLGR